MRSPVSVIIAAALTAASLAGAQAAGAPPASAASCGGTVANGYLYGVAATSPSDAWAVGWSAVGYATYTVIEHWNGTVWCRVPSPDPGNPTTPSDALYSVSATSATNAWAVGVYTDVPSGNYQTLILHWDGSTWSQVPSPDPAGPHNPNRLQAVTASSATNAWAVGDYGVAQNGYQLSLHFDGTSWKQVPGPHLNPPVLTGVGAAGTSAWATALCGCTSTGNVTERWNGTAWQRVSNPNRGTLTSVAVRSATSAWIAGGTNGNVGKTLILRWNGTAWKRVTSPSPAGSILEGITTTSATNAWAVGDSSGSGSGNRALIEHWNGTAWKEVPSPNQTGGAELSAVAATSASDAWAVGGRGITLQTLILHWNGTTWSRIPSP